MDAGRARYQFQILAETAAGLRGERHPHKILEFFLLSAQGGVGSRGGFAAILAENAADMHVVSSPRDAQVELPDVAYMQTLLAGLAGERRAPFFIPELPGFVWPGQGLLLVCPLDDGGYGLLGLLEPLHERGFDADDRQLVNGLGLLFQTSLRFAVYATRVGVLNAELEKRNTALDRQVFHLTALRDLAAEVSLTDLRQVVDTLLLTVLGHFSRQSGCLLLLDRAGDRVVCGAQGIEAWTNLSAKAADQVLYLCLAGARRKHLPPLHVEPVAELSVLGELDLGFAVDRGYLFALRANLYGALLLGPPLTASSEQDDGLLHTFVAQVVLHLKNADSFATIQELNDDLAAQNAALKQTIADLTRAQDHISVLEAAGKRIAGIVHRRAEDLARLRWVDFALILGLSVGMALLFNWQSPRGISLYDPPRFDLEMVSVERTHAMLAKEGALLIDARPREFFDRHHVPEAINIPPQLFDLIYMMHLAGEDPERPVLIYGRTVSRSYDALVAEKFLGRDHEAVYLVENGGEALLSPEAP